MTRKSIIGIGFGIAVMAVGLLYLTEWKAKEIPLHDQPPIPLATRPPPTQKASASLSIPQDAILKNSIIPNAPRLTRLPVKLISTLSVGDGSDSRSSAMIQSEDSPRGEDVRSYAVGQEQSFWSGVKITRILPNRVEFLHGAAREYLELDTSSSANAGDGPKQNALPSSGYGMPANFGSTQGSTALAPPPPRYIPKQMPSQAFPMMGNLNASGDTSGWGTFPVTAPRPKGSGEAEKNAESGTLAQ